MATIRDVAAHAQVSVATVSRVLNESGYADPATRARVLAAAAELNYQRNVNWSRLKSQSSRTILFLLANRQSILAMHMRLLVSCERVLRAHGYDLIFARHDYAAQVRPSELPLPRMLAMSGAVDGVLLAGLHHPNLLEVLAERGLPFAMVGNSFLGSAAQASQNCVFYDDRGAIEEAAAHLLRLGHRRIAFVGDTSLPWFRRRFEGYQQAMNAQGLPLTGVNDHWSVNNLDYGQLAVAQLLRDDHPPTAILAANDEIAAGVWKELTKRKIQIPQQISLIGLGDRAEFAILEPALASITVFDEQLGEGLSAMLLRRIQDPQQAQPSETYPCKLLERASCGPSSDLRKVTALKSA
jgi:LacI family transcriptional regulator